MPLMGRRGFLALVVVLLAACAPGASWAADAAVPVADPIAAEFFEKQVRPVLVEHCVKCHGGEKTRGGLKLTTREGLQKGGELGAVVAPDRPADSLLLQAVRYKNDKLQMPPDRKLPQAKIDALTKWVEMGTPWLDGADLTPAGVKPAAPAAHDGAMTVEQGRNFWSFKPLVRPEAPQVANPGWGRNPIDAFILSKLEQKGLKPAPPADKVALVRRVYFDLIGLPPTPAEVKAFVEDTSPDAYERLIETLLASPHYGEKWGRHWLDLVRYAETNSYERDGPKPHAWRYRDYVIRSFNDDKPYDRFLKEQLAGDELPDAHANPDNIIATGFYRLGIWDDEPVDRPQARYDGLDDIMATVGQVFLGVTIDCARCHDHKIDPLPQRDYYRLLAFFQNIRDYSNGGPGDESPLFMEPAQRQAFEAQRAERERQAQALETLLNEWHANFKQLIEKDPELAKTEETDLGKLIRQHGKRVFGEARFNEYRELRKRYETLKKAPADGPEMALCVTENGREAPPTHVLIRGSAHAPGPRVEPGFFAVLGGSDAAIPPPPPDAKSSGRRTVLADWITSKENPLTARVMANRIWQYHFGRGIVRSSNNFGVQGDLPTHPELLDWLASEFIARGWSIKQMHRLIMTSSAYRMSSRPDATALAADPRNDLFWRFDMRRLTAEELRDTILAVNGTLNKKAFGPSVYPPIPREVMQGQSRPGEGWHTSNAQDSARRSVYVFVKRSLRVPILESFDGAETDKSCPVRFVTVQPTQALGMLNSEFLNTEAQKLANRLRAEAGGELWKQVELGLQLVTQRNPSPAEVDRGVKLVTSLVEEDGATWEAAMRYFCLVTLNLNEFVYLD